MTDTPTGASSSTLTSINPSNNTLAATATTSHSDGPVARSSVFPPQAWERFWKAASDLSEWGKPGIILTVLGMIATLLSAVKFPAFWVRLYERTKNRCKFAVFVLSLKVETLVKYIQTFFGNKK